MDKAGPRVSVVVPVYNRIQITVAFLRKFSEVSYPNFEIIVVDDGSTDGTGEVIRSEFPSVRLRQAEGGLWWAKATNLGIADALSRGTDYILTINDDVSFKNDFLEKLVNASQQAPQTLVGAVIYEQSRPNNLWYAGGKIAWLQGELVHRRSIDDGPLLWLTGMGTLIPAEVFSKVGFYDEKNFPQYAADVDFTLRARKKGYRLAIASDSVIWNIAEESSQLIIRKKVTLRTFFLPLFSRRSDSMLSMRACLYWRYWPVFLIPVAFLFYYARYTFKQSIRLIKLR